MFETIVTPQEDAARKVFQQMLDALDYCHKLGIYHRQAMIHITCQATPCTCMWIASGQMPWTDLL